MKHFIDIADFSVVELENMLDLGMKLKAEQKSGVFRPLLKTRCWQCYFKSRA